MSNTAVGGSLSLCKLMQTPEIHPTTCEALEFFSFLLLFFLNLPRGAFQQLYLCS